MAVKFRDYYEVLGVKRTAGEDEIRQAFRRLARQYHPDMNQNDSTAEEKFKEINEANEVLSDAEKRKKYDQLGASWKNGADFSPPPGWQRERVTYEEYRSAYGDEYQRKTTQTRTTTSESSGGIFSDFFEMLFGDSDSKANNKSSATKRNHDAEIEIQLSLEDAHRGGRQRIALQRPRLCPACRGEGRFGSSICPSCKGTKQVYVQKPIEVNIPLGVRNGAVIKAPGHGHRGSDGKRGDLFIKIKLKLHAHFAVSGDDTYADLLLAPWEAALGTSLEIPTVDGKVSIRIAPGSQSGQRMRLKEHGLSKRGGGRGDHYLKIRIVVPATLTERERELYKQLSEASNFKPRHSS
jgi:DnaJ-class molecular chaperone